MSSSQAPSLARDSWLSCALERSLFGLAFAVPFGCAVWMLGLSPGWLDSPELVAASASLGLSHPPGHPSYLMAAHLASLLPLGSVAFRVALFSAFCFGLAAAFAYRATLHLLALVLGKRALRLHYRALTCCGIWSGLFTYSAMLQAVRPEVYTFHACLVMAALERLLAAVRTREEDVDSDFPWGLPRSPQAALWTAAWLLGVALANHHYLTLLLFPGMGWLLLRKKGQFARPRLALFGAICMLGVGLSTYTYLPVRSSQMPAVHWGEADSFRGFVWQITAQAWQRSVKPVHQEQSGTQRLMLLASIYIEQLGFGLLVALLGLYLLLRMSRWLGIAVVLWGGGVFLGRWLMYVDRWDADLHGYLLVSFLLFGVCVAFLSVGLWEQLQRLFEQEVGAQKRRRRLVIRAGQGVAALFVLLPLAWLPYSLFFPGERSFSLLDCDRRTQQGPLLWSELLEAPLPYGSVLLTSYYQSGFLRWYRKIIERHRPDIKLLQRNLLHQPLIAAQEGRRRPAWAPLLATFGRDPKRFFAQLRKITQQRDVCFEWYYDIPDVVARHLTPIGAFFCWVPGRMPSWRDGRATDDDAILEQQSYYWREVYRLLGASLKRDRECRNVLLWMHYQHALFYQKTRRWRAGRAEARHALRLSPQSPEVKQLLRFFKKKLSLSPNH